MNATNNLRHIEVCRIEPSRTPLRSIRKTEPEFVELMESIRSDGVLQPILVRPIKDREGYYEVVEGNHRFAVVRLLRHETIPCQIKELTDREVLIIQVKAQAVRPTDIKIYEYARRLRKLIDTDMTIRDLAATLDKSPAWVSRMLSLVNLDPSVIDDVNSGKINASKAIALSKLPQHLQPTFHDDAIHMKTVPFTKRTREAKRDYDAFLLNQKQEEQQDGVQPRIRGVKDIMAEADTFEAAGKVLTSCNANTPEMGWKACLAWIMRIDPVSVENRRQGIKDSNYEFLNNYRLRIKQRRMIEQLTFDTIDTSQPIGESQNDE